MKTIPIKNSKRECGTCKACCEGWLIGEAYGKQFSPGKPCHFLDQSGCSIYKNRPDHPCKNYYCEWMMNEDFPMWMRPDISKIIVTRKKIENIEFYSVENTGEEMSAKTLNWLFSWVMPKQLNMAYKIQGGVYRIGSSEFNQLSL